MSDHEEGVAFLTKEHKEKDGVDTDADGKEEGVPAGLGADKEVGLHGHVDTDTGKIYFPKNGDAWVFSPTLRKEPLG